MRHCLNCGFDQIEIDILLFCPNCRADLSVYGVVVDEDECEATWECSEPSPNPAEWPAGAAFCPRCGFQTVRRGLCDKCGTLIQHCVNRSCGRANRLVLSACRYCRSALPSDIPVVPNLRERLRSYAAGIRGWAHEELSEDGNTSFTFMWLAYSQIEYRYTGKHLPVFRFWTAQPGERVHLILEACKQINCRALCQEIEPLASVSGTLSPEGMEQLEECLRQRDETEAVIELASRMMSDLPAEFAEQPGEQLRSVVSAMATADDLLLRIDVLPRACRVFKAIAPAIRLPIDRDRQWWFPPPD